jgi:signal transduction histidine kinase
MARPHPIRWLQEHPVHSDAMMAAGLMIVGLLSHFLTRLKDVAAPDAFGAVLVVLASVPLAWRRRFTVSVLAVITLAQSILEVRNQAGPGWLGVLLAAYSLGAHRAGVVLKRVAIAVVVPVVVFTAVLVAVGGTPWGALASSALVIPAAIIFGDSMRRRRERFEHMAERVERAERERELLGHQQVQMERTRIARELHDVVAHSVSAMVIQAGAARRQMKVHPAHAEQALLSIEAAGRDAMTEMRRILGVLRDDSPEAMLTPQPSLAAIETLVAGSSDLPVDLRVDGDIDSMPAGLELCAYRVVQEALTNVRRHAGPVRRVEVSLRREPQRLLIEIEDDGRGASVSPGDGFGLIGMRERTVAHGGELFAGPRAGGGWRVRATFPLVTA